MRLILTFPLLLSLPAAAGASMMSYSVEAELVSQGPMSVRLADGTDCVGADCVPAGWSAPGAQFGGLQPGDTITATFDLETDAATPGPASNCEIDGESCGMFQSLDQHDPATGEVDTSWFTSTSMLEISMSQGLISFFSDAGSYTLSDCDAYGTPVIAGLPNNYCDFSGYEAVFEITSFEATSAPVVAVVAPTLLSLASIAPTNATLNVSAVPLPGGLVLGISALGLLWGMGRKRA